MGKQRVEYIDAMRGFTMILVVYSHVAFFCLGDINLGFNRVFILFRLPCFFFISGWLFYKAERQWNRLTFGQVIRQKFMVQIVPTTLFLLLLAPPPVFFSRLGATKGGYWFTFALFEFFVIYMVSAWGARRLMPGGVAHPSRRSDVVPLLVALLISACAFWYDASYHRLVLVHHSLSALFSALGFLGVIMWRYYLFFFLGTLARKHFHGFLRLTGRPSVVLLVSACFLAVALCPPVDDWLPAFAFFVAGGLSGLFVVFCFFRHAAPVFSREYAVGRALQFVGRRTLDVYLIHYFFLPRFLLSWRDALPGFAQPVVSCVFILAVALVVVGLSLLVSRLIRLSPVLSHYLLGVKYEG